MKVGATGVISLGLFILLSGQPSNASEWSALDSETFFQGSPDPSVENHGLFRPHDIEEGQIALLPTGENSFSARINALRQAKYSIRIQALIFTGDEAGIYISELLKEKHRSGVNVKIIVDAFSNPGWQTQWMYFDLKQHGIEVEGYEALWLQWFNEMADPNKRFHEKMWIIDGETDRGVAVVGGLNIANEYFRIDRADRRHLWRDQDVIVKGSVVGDMVETFDRNYAYFLSIKEKWGLLFNTNQYWGLTRNVLKKIGKIKVATWLEARKYEHVLELAKSPFVPDWQQARCRFFQSRPRHKETYIEQAYVKMIRDAKNEILIANAYFIPMPNIRNALMAAARRGVHIIILTNSTLTNDLAELTIVGRGYYKDLLSSSDEGGNVEIWEWEGKKPEASPSQGTLHAKYAVFDRKGAIVGSYNLDPRSAVLNSESVLIFENEILAKQLTTLFYENDLSYSRRIDAKEAREFLDPRESFYLLRKNIAELFEKQL